MRPGLSNKNYWAVIIILGTLTAIAPFSIDMYLPAFPAMADSFGADINELGLTLTSFFAGISVGQLLVGPLADRFGRKIPLMAGLSLFVIATIGCAISNSVETLIVLRLFQAIGGCAGMVISRAMVRDIFTPAETAKVFSMLMLVMGVAPVIAPSLGSIINALWGWRFLFAALTGIGVLILAATTYLPETRGANKAVSLRPGMVTKEYLQIIRIPWFTIHALAGGFAGAGLFAYISGSPFVYMKLFQLSGTEYALLFSLNAAGLILGSQLNRWWLSRRTSSQIINVCSSAQLLTGIALLAVVTFHGPVPVILALIFVYLLIYGFIYPNTSALAMEPFTTNAGSASALMGSLQMVIGALASAAVSYCSNGTAIPMTAVMLVCALGSFLLLRIRTATPQPLAG